MFFDRPSRQRFDWPLGRVLNQFSGRVPDQPQVWVLNRFFSRVPYRPLDRVLDRPFGRILDRSFGLFLDRLFGRVLNRVFSSFLIGLSIACPFISLFQLFWTFFFVLSRIPARVLERVYVCSGPGFRVSMSLPPPLLTFGT